MSRFVLFPKALAAFSLFQVAVAVIDISRFATADIIERDVAIIGGGAAGSHAAVRLREDLAKTVVVIEKQNELGGHVDTFFDPDTGKAYEYGVQSYIEYGNATQFFARFNISVGTPERRVLETRYVDFASGRELTNSYSVPAAADVTAALQKYVQVCEQYEDILVPGYWNFPAGDQIPEELLMPIVEFMTKHGILAALPRIFGITGMGVGSRQDFATAPTIHVMQAFGAPIARSFIGGVPLFAPRSSNMDLYHKIAHLLGDDILFKSTVVDSERGENGIKLVVRSPRGRKLVLAKRLLLAIQPTLENYEPFDLSSREREIFSKGRYGRGFTSIVTHSALPKNTSLVNLPEAAVPDNYFAFIKPPAVTRFEHYGNPTKLYRVLIGSNDPAANSSEAQRLVRDAFDKFIQSGVIPDPGDEELKFVGWSDHGAAGYGVSADDLRKNHMRNMYSLQGQRSTWFTGGGWAVDFTTILWGFNDGLLPKVIEGI